MNDPNFKLSEISTYFDVMLYSDSLLSFIQWLKNYNMTHTDKISFWGFDINQHRLKSQVDLFNFVYNLNMNKNINELDTICKSLLHYEDPFERSISILNETPNLATVLNKDELKILLHCLKITKQESDSYYRFCNRNKYMNDIATFIVDNFLKNNETVTFYGHFGHLNYSSIADLSIMNHNSFGYYMKNKYQDAYSCIALTTNNGSAILTKSEKEFKKSIKSTFMPAPIGSLEYQLNNLKADSLYVSMNKLNCSDVLKLRFIGNQNTSYQFMYFIPKSRMDGALFVKTATNITKRRELIPKFLNPNPSIIYAYKDALDKMKRKELKEKK